MTGAEMERLLKARGARPGGPRPDGLERRYRRLLAWYPRDHRAEHGEEMLGVLMAGAPDGQARPGARESADVIAGALRIRLRRIAGCFGTPHWRDALAVVSVLAPALAAAMFLEAFDPRTALFIVRHSAEMNRVAPVWWLAGGLGQVPLAAGWVAALALVALNRRRAALAAAGATMIAQALIATWIVAAGGWWPPMDPFMSADGPAEFFLGAVSLVALAGSGGPRRGFEILGRWRAGLILGGLLAWTAARQFAVVWAFPMTRGGLVTQHRLMVSTTLAILAAGAAVAAMCLRSPVGRRAVLLIVPVASPFTLLWLVARLAGVSRYASPVPAQVVWLLYLALALILAVLAVGGRRRPEEAGPLASSPG